MFGAGTEVKRIALNMDQVDEFNPPPNPAKTTDSRYEMYIADYGSESWELDALEPKVIVDLIEKTVKKLRDPDKYGEVMERESAEREKIENAAVVIREQLEGDDDNDGE